MPDLAHARRLRIAGLVCVSIAAVLIAAALVVLVVTEDGPIIPFVLAGSGINIVGLILLSKGKRESGES